MGILLGRSHVVLRTFPRVIGSNFVRNSIQWGQTEFIAIYDLALKACGALKRDVKSWYGLSNCDDKSVFKEPRRVYTNIIK